jgi:hypothetical protein
MSIISEELIKQDKIDSLRMEKQNAFDSLYDKYKTHSFYHSFHEYGNKGNDKLLNYQEKQLNSNKMKLRNLDSDINTLTKQTKISKNEFLYRNNQIKILKTVFYFLLLTLGNIILHKMNIIPTKILYLIQLILTLIFGIILLTQSYWNNKRMVNDFNVFNWDINISSSEEILPEEEIKKCTPETKSEVITSETNKTKINIYI